MHTIHCILTQIAFQNLIVYILPSCWRHQYAHSRLRSSHLPMIVSIGPTDVLQARIGLHVQKL